MGGFFGVKSINLFGFVALGRPLTMLCEESEIWDTQVIKNRTFYVIKD